MGLLLTAPAEAMAPRKAVLLLKSSAKSARPVLLLFVGVIVVDDGSVLRTVADVVVVVVVVVVAVVVAVAKAIQLLTLSMSSVRVAVEISLMLLLWLLW